MQVLFSALIRDTEKLTDLYTKFYNVNSDTLILRFCSFVYMYAYL